MKYNYKYGRNTTAKHRQNTTANTDETQPKTVMKHNYKYRRNITEK